MLRRLVVASVAPASLDVPDERYGQDQKDEKDDYTHDDCNPTTLTERSWVIPTSYGLVAGWICAKLKAIHDDDDDLIRSGQFIRRSKRLSLAHDKSALHIPITNNST